MRSSGSPAATPLTTVGRLVLLGPQEADRDTHTERVHRAQGHGAPDEHFLERALQRGDRALLEVGHRRLVEGAAVWSARHPVEHLVDVGECEQLYELAFVDVESPAQVERRNVDPAEVRLDRPKDGQQVGDVRLDAHDLLARLLVGARAFQLLTGPLEVVPVKRELHR
jgi:hypothetical protein